MESLGNDTEDPAVEVDLRASQASVVVVDLRGTLGLPNPLGPSDPCFEDPLGLFACLHSLV